MCVLSHKQWSGGRNSVPCRGLKRSLPNLLDLGSGSVAPLIPLGETRSTYLNDTPYWLTASYPLFHTSVTSQALVADKRQDKKAETALPPTTSTRVVSLLIRLLLYISAAREEGEGASRGDAGVMMEE